MTEDALIASLRDLVRAPHRRVLIGIGDDAAVWQPSRSHRSVITTDALVEGVHFNLQTMPLADVGWRSMTSNLSDAAAIGARPVLATVALMLPATLDEGAVLELYSGIAAAASEAGCAIAGGDLSRAPVLALSITVVGEVRPSNLKTRSGGRPGDVLAVTGPLGASRAGLDCADNESMLSQPLRDEALGAHRRPKARWREGLWLSASANVHAMMDLSDGLATDARRLCAASRCAGRIDSVPVARCAQAAAAALGFDPQAYALAGGEDFELLLAVQPRAFGHLAGRYAKRFGRKLERVGDLREGSGLFMRKGGREEPVTATGWDHFESR